MGNEFLCLRGIHKSFSGVSVLEDVNLCFEAGKIYAFVGENGAGKSTLSRIITGEYIPDKGTISVDGRKCGHMTIRASRQAGIRMVQQELQIVPDLSITENVFIGDEILRGPFVDFKTMAARTQKLLDMVGLKHPPKTLVGSIDIAGRQLIEICRAINTNVRLLILDEPTSSLSNVEIDKLFDVIRKFRDQGVAIIFITHRLQEVIRLADKVVVLKDGRITAIMPIGDATEDKIISHMVGRSYQDYYNRMRTVFGKEALRLENFTGIPLKGVRNAFTPQGINLSLYEGEVLGLSGIVGSGRTELIKMIYGEYPRQKDGKIFLFGEETKIEKPRDAIKKKLGWVTEDRKKEGLILRFSIERNIAVPNLRSLMKGIFMDRGKERRMAEAYIARLNVKTTGRAQEVIYLSGGNQQKVLLGKWLASGPRILILDEPTRGIDVGAKAEIYKLINQLTAQGIAILFISSDLPEIMGMSDRILVLFEGKITGEFTRDEFDEENIMRSASGRVKR